MIHHHPYRNSVGEGRIPFGKLKTNLVGDCLVRVTHPNGVFLKLSFTPETVSKIIGESLLMPNVVYILPHQHTTLWRDCIIIIDTNCLETFET